MNQAYSPPPPSKECQVIPESGAYRQGNTLLIPPNYHAPKICYKTGKITPDLVDFPIEIGNKYRLKYGDRVSFIVLFTYLMMAIAVFLYEKEAPFVYAGIIMLLLWMTQVKTATIYIDGEQPLGNRNWKIFQKMIFSRVALTICFPILLSWLLQNDYSFSMTIVILGGLQQLISNPRSPLCHLKGYDNGLHKISGAHPDFLEVFPDSAKKC